MIAKYGDCFYHNVNVSVSGEEVTITNPNMINSAIVPRESVELYHADSEVQEMIESTVAEHDQAMQDTLQVYYDNEQQLLEQIEELKAKIAQPVEISRELAKAIDLFQNKYGKTWEYHFIKADYYKWLPSEAEIAYEEITPLYALEIIKNGYTIKPDPLREGIASLVARYTNEDGVSGETDLIEKLAEYVRGHFGGDTE